MAKKIFTDESLATFVDEIKAYTEESVSTKANSSHNHSASNITSGSLSSDRLPTVPISKGGTGATTAASALTNFGITATAAELNKLDGVTATTAELNYVDGVTSNIQTQLNGKTNKKTQTANVLGTSKTTETVGDNQLFFSKGGIFGGTAAAAGLVTRGICGVTQPTDGTGACTKDHLYVNYDGNNDNSYSRKLVLGAGSTGTDLGSGLYSYSAARGDAVKGYVDGVVADINTNLEKKYDSTVSRTKNTVLASPNGSDGNATFRALVAADLPTVPVSKGGTGSTTAAGALTNLGLTATSTELNYMDGVTSNVQTQLNGKASTSVATQSANGLLSAANKKQLDYGGTPIVTTAGDGAAYTATVDGMSALTVGMELTIIPHVNSTSTQPTLNVNSLGAKAIRMPISYNSSATSVGSIAAWLVKNKPVTVQYDGSYWKTISMPRPSAQYLYGSVPIANGGTGATTGAVGLKNLLAAGQTVLSSHQYGNTFPTSATDGTVFFKKTTGGIDELSTELINALALAAHPVGSIYMSENATSPADMWGGTWEQIKDTFLLAAGDVYVAGSTGGEAEHVLTIEEQPSVTGGLNVRLAGGARTINVHDGTCFTLIENGGEDWANQSDTGSASKNTDLLTFDNGGANVAHNNMPPYQSVYMWKRIA